MTCNHVLCCNYPRSVCVRTAPGNVNMIAYGKINTRLSPSQVVLLQTAHYWANAGVLLGARMLGYPMHRERGSFRSNLNFRRYVLCCFPTNRNSHPRIVPIFARRYYVDIRRFERQRLKYTFALFRSHFEYHN